jgi:hypothetical protein
MIGWNAGALSDGRPYRVDAWAVDQTTILTFILSTQDLEDAEEGALSDLLEREGLITFDAEEFYVGLGKMTDSSGQEMWSINVVLSEGDDVYASTDIDLQPYEA